jgi:hypothetical protein
MIFRRMAKKYIRRTPIRGFLSSAGEDRGGDPRSSELANPFAANGLTCCTSLKLLAQPCGPATSSANSCVEPPRMLVIETSNAQRKQSHPADTENQHDQRNRIVIEPMATLCTHGIMHFATF